MHSQRERVRERSAGSANSTTGGHHPQQSILNLGGKVGPSGPQCTTQNQQSDGQGPQYNNLLSAHNKYATQNQARAGSHHQYKKMQSPQVEQLSGSATQG